MRQQCPRTAVLDTHPGLVEDGRIYFRANLADKEEGEKSLPRFPNLCAARDSIINQLPAPVSNVLRCTLQTEIHQAVA